MYKESWSCVGDFPREINNPRNVKLVFDVLSFDMPQIKAALLFACGDSLVCETVEDARMAAYGLDTRHQVITGHIY